MPELNAMALSPAGQYLAAETSSGVVKTWDLTTDRAKELWTGTTNDLTAAPPSGETGPSNTHKGTAFGFAGR